MEPAGLLRFLRKLKEVFDVCDEDADGFIRVEHFVALGLQFGQGDEVSGATRTAAVRHRPSARPGAAQPSPTPREPQPAARGRPEPLSPSAGPRAATPQGRAPSHGSRSPPSLRAPQPSSGPVVSRTQLGLSRPGSAGFGKAAPSAAPLCTRASRSGTGPVTAGCRHASGSKQFSVCNKRL